LRQNVLKSDTMGLFNRFGNEDSAASQEGNIEWNALIDLTQLDEIVSLSFEKPVFIFKHSTRCGISRMVLKRFEKEYKSNIGITAFFLDLLTYREVSDAVSLRFNVVHQSPQLLLIKEGKSVYDASHDSIDAETLEANSN
jgi:monothiol bacilliredoxin